MGRDEHRYETVFEMAYSEWKTPGWRFSAAARRPFFWWLPFDRAV